MNEDQKKALADLVKVNEETKGARIVIDYAILLVGRFQSESRGLNSEMTDYVQNIYNPSA